MEKQTKILLWLKNKTIMNMVYWVGFALAIFIPVQTIQSISMAFRISIGIVLPLIPAVYFHFFILERFHKRGENLKYIIILILFLILAGVTTQYFIDLLVPEVKGGIKAFLNPPFLIIFTSGFRYYTQGLKLQMQLQEAQAKQYKAELDLLKFQVNPHFFFNTLNNLFAMARKHKDQSTAKGIAKLAHLMRYLIYDCNVDKISLEKEIEQIGYFLALQKLRFSEDDNIKIVFTKTGNYEDKLITPMLLIPFVENAFKHGISLSSKSEIIINLSTDNQHFFFEVTNQINKNKKDKELNESGIGLINVRRRLELLYPDSHELKIENSGDTFYVALKLDL